MRAAVLPRRGDASLERAIGARHEPLALLGELVGGGTAYLVRERSRGELAVARLLKRKKGDTGGPPIVAMTRELDASIPTPMVECPSCGTALGAWAQKCVKCGARLAAAPAAAELAAREPERWTVLGTMPVYGGGAVTFAERAEDGAIVALHAREWHDTAGGDHVVLVDAGPLAPLPAPTTEEREAITTEELSETPTTEETAVPAEAARVADETAAATPADDEPGHIAELPTAVFEAPNRKSQGVLHEPTRWVNPSNLGSGPMARQAPTDGVPVPKVCPLCGSEYETDARFCPKDGTALRPKGGSDALIGQVIADRYHVLKRVGEGGMGRVYLAEHVRMGRMCALKVMRSALLNDDEAMARFAREASNAARILHPNVAAVFDYGESEGIVYLVMEYVEGEALSTILLRERALPVARVLDLTKQVADALVAAHEMGVIHRDLKPDNILVTRRGEREVAKVVDFGIAKAIAESPHEALTRSGLVIGTPEFMSPEQLLGDPIDARTDLYSLGCILFLMLTGTQAAEAPTREAMLKRRLHELPPHPRAVNRALPPELDAIVVRLLSSTPSERFASAADLRQALESVPLVDSTAVTPVLGTEAQAPTKLRFETPPPVARPRRSGGRIAFTTVAVASVVTAALLARRNFDRAALPTVAHVDTTRVDTSRADSAARVRPPAAGATTTAGVTRPPAPSGTATTPTPGTTTSVRPPLVARVPSDTQPRTSQASSPYSAVLAPLNAFALAVQSNDIDRVRAAYPGLSREQQRNFEKMFAQGQVVSARIVGSEVDVSGAVAHVRFRLLVRTSYRSSLEEVVIPPQTYTATLARRGTGWVLTELRPGG